MSNGLPDPTDPRKGDRFMPVLGGDTYEVTAVGRQYALLLGEDGVEVPEDLDDLAGYVPALPPYVPEAFRLHEFDTGSEVGWSTVKMASATGRKIRVRPDHTWVEVGDE